MKSTSTKYMAIDQFGNTYHNLIHPRKDLMERIGIQHVNKQFTDYKDGHTEHTGYVIGNLWLTVYKVLPFKD